MPCPPEHLLPSPKNKEGDRQRFAEAISDGNLAMNVDMRRQGGRDVIEEPMRSQCGNGRFVIFRTSMRIDDICIDWRCALLKTLENPSLALYLS